MEEEIQGNGGIEQHATGTNNQVGGDLQHAVQNQEDDDSGIDIDKENGQDGVNSIDPGHARHAESYHKLITEHVCE